MNQWVKFPILKKHQTQLLRRLPNEFVKDTFLSEIVIIFFELSGKFNLSQRAPASEESFDFSTSFWLAFLVELLVTFDVRRSIYTITANKIAIIAII